MSVKKFGIKSLEEILFWRHLFFSFFSGNARCYNKIMRTFNTYSKLLAIFSLLLLQACTKASSFQTMNIMNASDSDLGSSAPAPTPTPSPDGIGTNRGIMWGINGHPYGGLSGGPYSSIDQQIQLMATMGIKHYRVDFYTADNASFTLVQSLLDSAKAYNITITPVLIPATGANEQASYNTAYALGQAYAAKFPGILAFELGNEENNSVLDPSGDHSNASDFTSASGYAAVRGKLRGLLDGVRAGNAKARGALGISGGCNVGFLQALYNDGLRWDITVAHPYDSWGDPENLTLTYDHSQANGSCAKSNMMAALASFGKPLWLTEFNYTPAVTANDKTAMGTGLQTMMKRFTSMAQKYDIEAVDVYEMFDEPAASGNEAYFGIFTSTGSGTAASTMVSNYISNNPSMIYPVK